MVANPFSEWLAEVAAAKVAVRPDDIDAEARCNQWSFSLSPEQAAGVATGDVCEFAAEVAASRRAWLTAHGTGPMTIYWWHDGQAGQLCFSLVSASHGRLPFGAKVAAAPSPGAVVSDWLTSSCLHGIPWGELRMLADDEVYPEPDSHMVNVWSEVLA